MPLYRLPNIAAFIAFRVFFNARFYYPVFALLFLDFGLTLSEFSLSNLLWAAAIVLLEVPSGALADVVGRKKLVVLAAVLMILEMGVLLLAQPHSGHALLALFCLNRLLSGAGEAMASGADEALAYDSLKQVGQESRWSEVLEWQTRLSSLAFFVVMLVGAAVYDPAFLNGVWEGLGRESGFEKSHTLKLPIWLTFASAVLALLAALSLRPLASERQAAGRLSLAQPFRKVREVAVKLSSRRDVLLVLLAAVLFDQAARASLTMSSKTFAAFGIGAAWFGVIGAGMALVGALISGSARRLAEEKSQNFVFWLIFGLSAFGLLGQATFQNSYAVGFLLCLSAVMSLVGFFSSYYLNRLAESEERATLLSFKGLMCNLGFGLVSLYYSLVSATWPSESGRDYLNSLFSLAVYFLLCTLLFCLWKRKARS